jgi:hypothetical protein
MNKSKLLPRLDRSCLGIPCENSNDMIQTRAILLLLYQFRFPTFSSLAPEGPVPGPTGTQSIARYSGPGQGRTASIRK